MTSRCIVEKAGTMTRLRPAAPIDVRLRQDYAGLERVICPLYRRESLRLDHDAERGE